MLAIKNAWKKYNGLPHFGENIGITIVMEAKEVMQLGQSWNRLDKISLSGMISFAGNFARFLPGTYYSVTLLLVLILTLILT